MSKHGVALLVAGVVTAAMARGLADDRQVIAQAAASRPQAAPPASVPTGPSRAEDELAAMEREARSEANLALARLELVRSRKALRDERYEEAARKAHRVLALLKQLPPEMDTSVYELQAEGILAKAARAGINVEALRPNPDAPVPEDLAPGEDDPNLEAKLRQAARVARGYTGADTPDIDTRGDVAALRDRALSRPTVDRYGYRPTREIIDTDALRMREEERLYYQAALEGAYRDSEVRALVEADEARVAADGVISYPDNWPEIVKKREQYRGGMIARSPSWHDQEGREWYVALYDIHDLIYVPPDFAAPSMDPRITLREALDREALRQQSYIFRGGPEDLAAGIPLLRYFGGVDDWAYRGPKYSLERQQQIVELIKAFVGPPPAESEARIVPLPP